MASNSYKVLLVYPGITSYATNLRRIVPPLGLAYLASYLEAGGIEVAIIDSALEGYDNVRDEGRGMCTYGLDDDELARRIRAFNPALVGVTFPFSCQRRNSVAACRVAKSVDPGIRTVVGGVHVTAMPEQTLADHPEIDFVVRGEGEDVLLSLVRALCDDVDYTDIEGLAFWDSTGVPTVKGNPDVIEDVEALPFPARHLLNMERYLDINVPHGPYARGKRTGNILTSRGCPGRCIYCSSCNFSGRIFRARSPESVFREIDLLVNEYRAEELQFEDDNLTFDKDRANEIFRRLRNYNLVWCTPNGVRIDRVDADMLKLMKESGCYQLTFGIESGNQRVLHKVIRKPIVLDRVKPLVDEAKRLGILVHLFFMVGLPTETREEMLETLAFAKKVNPDSASFSIATPLPGSDLYARAVREEMLFDGFTFEDTIYRKACMKIEGFEKEEFEEFVDRLNYRFNASLVYRNPPRFFKKYFRSFARAPASIFKSFRKNA
jgi:anaerobic magnesium-protoporphyrin IX monomethyl ester cyclase